MHLRPYSTRPLRALFQVLSDLAVLAWVVVWVEVGRAVDSAVHAVARPGYTLQNGADDVASSLRAAGNGVARVPMVGDPLSSPLRSAGGAAGGVADAGRELGDRISAAALPIALAVTLLAVVPVLAFWLLLRWRFARRAGACARLARVPEGDRLLALRALANRPPRRLIGISPDPVGDWLRADGDVVQRLADLELRLVGVSRRRVVAGSAAAAEQAGT